MAIDLDRTYAQLAGIVGVARRFLWNGGGEYTGPVSPLGLGIHLDCRRHALLYWFVLAECVTPAHLASAWDEESPGGIVLVKLKQDFTFAEWDPAAATLAGITAVCSSDGTFSAYDMQLATNPDAKVCHSLIYSVDQQSRNTHLVAPKRLLLAVLAGTSGSGLR